MHAGPGHEAADGGHPGREEVTRADDDDEEEREEAERRGIGERVDDGLEVVAQPVLEGLDAFVGVMLAQERADAGGGADLQPPQLAVGDGARRLRAAAGGAASTRMQEVPAPGVEHGERLAAAGCRREDQGFERGQPDGEGDEPQQ